MADAIMQDTTTTPVIGRTYTVADDPNAPHYFPAGTRVRVLRDNDTPARGDRPAIPAHRWLCQGQGPKGTTIVQWLAAEHLTD